MSLNHIEALTEALGAARRGQLSDSEFQVIVLQGLISLKESHVSLRSRLFNLEGRGFFEGDEIPYVYKESMSLQNTSPSNGLDDPKHLAAEIKAAINTFNFNSVRLFQRVFDKECQENCRHLTFNAAVSLLTKHDFKYYGDGKYPLSHYLREVVGSRTTVSFPNFVQAISMSISKPIPLGYKEGFEDMDLDHNGKLDAKEVFNMMKKISDSCYSWADVEDFLASTDMDHDGKMDYAEMLKAFYFSQS
ncbi:hypothetical protein ACHWQZ_G011003 [Mnemiopsis leidyi]